MPTVHDGAALPSGKGARKLRNRHHSHFPHPLHYNLASCQAAYDSPSHKLTERCSSAARTFTGRKPSSVLRPIPMKRPEAL